MFYHLLNVVIFLYFFCLSSPYIYFCVCVCVCVCERERERERVTEIPILQIIYAVQSAVVSLEHFIKFGDDIWNSCDDELPW